MNPRLDDLSQITFVHEDMSQKRSDMYQNIWTICDHNCHNFVSYLDNLSQYVTCHICHNFILDDLSQVIFFVRILIWMIGHKSYLS